MSSELVIETSVDPNIAAKFENSGVCDIHHSPFIVDLNKLKTLHLKTALEENDQGNAMGRQRGKCRSNAPQCSIRVAVTVGHPTFARGKFQTKGENGAYMWEIAFFLRVVFS